MCLGMFRRFVEKAHRSVSTGSRRSLEITIPPSQRFGCRQCIAASGNSTGGTCAEANRTNCRSVSACRQDAWESEGETHDPPQILAAAETARIILVGARLGDSPGVFRQVVGVPVIMLNWGGDQETLYAVTCHGLMTLHSWRSTTGIDEKSDLVMGTPEARG